MTVHELGLDARVLHGHFSRDLEPVLAVDPGHSVRFSAPDAGWHLTVDERFTPRAEAEYAAARIDAAWLTFGFDEHLGRAAEIAVDGMVALMTGEHGFSETEALAFASVVVDLRVTQVVNGLVGVHAVLGDDAWS